MPKEDQKEKDQKEQIPTDYDLLIIGGGINGCGIARDAAGRGLKVLLVEMSDLASATSSKSTKLIHGGLRYLEYFEFLLVHKALTERETLLRLAPHIIHPMKFILPHEKHLRPIWMIRLGLFLYDHLALRRTLGKSKHVKLDPLDPLNPLRPEFHEAFSYYDCWVDDARLVILNAMDARDKGAEILPRTKFLSARNLGSHWQAEIAPDIPDQETQPPQKITSKKITAKKITARAIINAAGPWVADIITDHLSLPVHNRLRLVKGSHILVPSLFAGHDSYILQNADGRIIFAIPYETDFTLIGTTDVPFTGDPAEVSISDEEIDYLCHHINAHFRPTLPHGKALSAKDVVSSFAGVRPLYDDAAKEASGVTRDFVLALRQDGTKDPNQDGAPLLSVFGGKITTYRHLAEKALEKLADFFPDMAKNWTATAPLPGGDIPQGDMGQFILQKRQQYPWLDENLCQRYARLYGTRMDILLEGIGQMADAGKAIGPGLYDYEAEFLTRHEWATHAEDILWRRTKLGLFWTEEDVENLEKWLKEKYQKRRG